LDIKDNVLPYIEGEEEKMRTEPLKILGILETGKISYAEIKISAQCNRVNVPEGHLESVFFGLKKNVPVEEIKKTLSEFNPLKYLALPSSPEKLIIVKDERPQPKHDRNEGKRMSCVVGGVIEDSVLGYHMIILSHNTIRGAAGGAILNAELLYKRGFLRN
jgi:aspartate-semialdehyde dehydrogenase